MLRAAAAGQRLAWAGRLASLSHLWPAAGAPRAYAGSATVDQMLQYVRRDLQGQGQTAIDVLRSGLSMQPDPAAGYDSGRLHLALSEAFTAEHDWAQAASAASSAAAAFAAAAAQLPAAAALSGVASCQAVRALLAAGRDKEAAAAADGAALGRQSGPLLLAGLSQQLLVAHATAGGAAAKAAASGELLGALRDALAAAQRQQKPAGGSSAGAGASAKADEGVEVLLALGHKAAGDAALAQGSLDAAAASYDAAHKALAHNVAAISSGSSSSGGGGSGTAGGQQHAEAVLSARLAQEVAADISMGRAQVHMAAKAWEAAEEVLGEALRAAEAAAGAGAGAGGAGDTAGGGGAPVLAPVLLLLAGGYCRSARVLLAEGLLREAAKLLGGSEPARLLEPASGHQAAHPTLRAAVAWRYAQLLTALPNRGGEAAAWGGAARRLWDDGGAGPGFPSSPSQAADGGSAGGGSSGSNGGSNDGSSDGGSSDGSSSIQAVLGDEVALKGEGAHGHGRGAVVSLLTRRLLPVLSA